MMTSLHSGCQEWGVYLVSRDQNGNIVEEELLYTYFVGSCGTVNTEDQQAPDYGGGSNEADYMEMLQEYAAAESGDGHHSHVAPQDEQETEGAFEWTVVSGGFGSWAIKALTEFSYKRYPFRDLTLAPRFEYHLSKYNTLKSYFVGSNLAIKSTWTQQVAKDWVLNNGTEKAQGQSMVTGTIVHKLSLSYAIISQPELTFTRSGNCVFNPR